MEDIKSTMKKAWSSSEDGKLAISDWQQLAEKTTGMQGQEGGKILEKLATSGELTPMYELYKEAVQNPKQYLQAKNYYSQNRDEIHEQIKIASESSGESVGNLEVKARVLASLTISENSMKVEEKTEVKQEPMGKTQAQSQENQMKMALGL